MDKPSRILLTGAAGIVGTVLRPVLRESYQSILLSDLVKISDLGENESFQSCDLTDLDSLVELVRDVQAIIHLGGLVGANYTFDEVVGPNIVGTHNIFEAARLNGVRRVIYASSHHVVGFTPRGNPIDHLSAPRPNGEYGLSKAYGEAAASYYVDNYTLEVLSIRIGYVGNDVSTNRRLYTWISPRDLAQLIEIGLTCPDLDHEIVYGISETPEPGFFDNRNAVRLGYRPRDRSIDQVKDRTILDEKPNLDTIEEGVVGGGFAGAGFEGDIDRVLKRK